MSTRFVDSLERFEVCPIKRLKLVGAVGCECDHTNFYDGRNRLLLRSCGCGGHPSI